MEMSGWRSQSAHLLVQVSRYAAGVVPVLTLRSDPRIFKSHASCQSPIMPLHIHSRSAIILTAPRTIHKSLAAFGGVTGLWQVYRLSRIYAPQAHLPYMQSLSRSGLLESRLRRENDPSDRLNPYLLPRPYAAFLRVTCMPALVARVISISRLNLSHLPLIKSETLD